MNATLTRSRSPWRAGLMAAGLSAGVNALIFALAVAAGVFSSLWMQPDAWARCSSAPSSWSPCSARWRVPAVYVLLRKRSRRPERTFAVVAAVVLLLSFAAPFAIPGRPWRRGWC
jgi:hypothetical protein